MKQIILQKLPTECPWRDTLYWNNSTDSTNTQAKLLAQQGAPHGTVLIAGEQTGGRGRLGRSFESQIGMGVYLSVILRPQCPADKLMHLTCAAAVAMCDAVEKVSGNQVKIAFEIAASEFDAAVQKAYLKVRGRVNVPGFRKGKAPRKMIESM